jgi:hypothetical protein
VAHDEFKNRPIDAILAKLAPNGVYVDVRTKPTPQRFAREASTYGVFEAAHRRQEAHRTLPAHELDRKRGKARGQTPLAGLRRHTN